MTLNKSLLTEHMAIVLKTKTDFHIDYESSGHFCLRKSFTVIKKLVPNLFLSIKMVRLTTQEKIFIVKTYWKNGETIARVNQAWWERFGTQPPVRKSIVLAITKFNEYGSIENRKPPGKNRTVTGEEATEAVRVLVERNPRQSSKDMAEELGFDRRQVLKILRNRLNMKPYRATIVFALKPQDRPHRVAFCELMQNLCRQDPTVLGRMWYSDESGFNLDAVPNKKSTVCWTANNPDFRIEKFMRTQRGLMVWAAISRTGIIGPYFFNEDDDEEELEPHPTTVNAARYLGMLQTFFWDNWRQQPNWQNNIFMQDGAPPHFALPVRNWLNENLPNRWIGRGSPNIAWPPRSPDLTPCDSFLWGYIKNKVYARRPATLRQLQTFIEDAFQSITGEMLQNVFDGILGRYQKCVDAGGEQLT